MTASYVGRTHKHCDSYVAYALLYMPLGTIPAELFIARKRYTFEFMSFMSEHLPEKLKTDITEIVVQAQKTLRRVGTSKELQQTSEVFVGQVIGLVEVGQQVLLKTHLLISAPHETVESLCLNSMAPAQCYKSTLPINVS